MTNREFACFDADGTIFEGFCIIPIMNSFADEGVVSSSAVNLLDEQQELHDNGVIDYPSFVIGVLEVASKSLKGIEVSVAVQLASEYFESNRQFYGYVQPTIEALRDKHISPLLVTGEPQFIAEGLKRTGLFDSFYSSEFGTEQGVFTGEIDLALGRRQKVQALTNLKGTISHAYGDSDGDIDMLGQSIRAFCIRPSNDLRNVASSRDWTIIDNPDLPRAII